MVAVLPARRTRQPEDAVTQEAAAEHEGEVAAVPKTVVAATVVLVEDDPDLQFLTTLMLTRSGYVVRSYGDAREAVPACIENPPDAVVLDWMLPGMTGLEALRELRAHPSTAELPVVMATACDLPTNVAAAMDSGAQGYVVKPFSVDELLRAVGAAIAARPASLVAGAA